MRILAAENKINNLNLIINKNISKNIRDLELDFSNNEINNITSIKDLVNNQIYLKNLILIISNNEIRDIEDLFDVLD
jgi:hypothetical protein